MTFEDFVNSKAGEKLRIALDYGLDNTASNRIEKLMRDTWEAGRAELEKEQDEAAKWPEILDPRR
jgi:hypothetical protein